MFAARIWSFHVPIVLLLCCVHLHKSFQVTKRKARQCSSSKLWASLSAGSLKQIPSLGKGQAKSGPTSSIALPVSIKPHFKQSDCCSIRALLWEQTRNDLRKSWLLEQEDVFKSSYRVLQSIDEQSWNWVMAFLYKKSVHFYTGFSEEGPLTMHFWK